MTVLPDALPRHGPESEPSEVTSGYVGALLGKYRVLGLLGSGGMGLVFRVQHLELEREFALKTLRREWAGDSAARLRFLSEVRALAAIRSEYVVPIVDAGTLPDGAPYFVMEALHGRTLRELLACEEHLAASRVIQIGIHVCLGLARVHAAGFIHRDLKPENLFVARTEHDSEKTSILDFGIVRKDNSDCVATSAGILIGTARYMAPEQVNSDAKLGPAADIFSLGTILYECVAGFSPFEDVTVERRIFKIANSDFSPLSEVDQALPADLILAIHRAMSHSPEDRYESAAAFAGALARCQHGQTWPVDADMTLARPRFVPGFQSHYSRELEREEPSTSKRARKVFWSAIVACALLATLDRLVYSRTGLRPHVDAARATSAIDRQPGPQAPVERPMFAIASAPTSSPQAASAPPTPVRRLKQPKSSSRSVPREALESDWASFIESRH